MKVLGLDLGTKSLGVAVSDPHGLLARGVENYRFSDGDYEAAINKTLEWIKQERIETVVLGLPKNMNGSVGPQGEISLAFKAMLESTASVEVVLWDERLSSRIASQQMISNKLKTKRRKNTLDQQAAVVILQSYLDSKK